jgi:hypothetical protein
VTVLEGNQAYRAAMKLLWDARLATHNEHDLVSHGIICNAQQHLTNQENADMKASFAKGGL